MLQCTVGISSQNVALRKSQNAVLSLLISCSTMAAEDFPKDFPKCFFEDQGAFWPMKDWEVKACENAAANGANVVAYAVAAHD